jgi:hypothetical protein
MQEDFSYSEACYDDSSSQDLYSISGILESFSLYLEAIFIFHDVFEMISTLRTSMSIAASKGTDKETYPDINEIHKKALKKYNDVVSKASQCKEIIEAESIEQSEVDCIGKILYSKALKIGGDAAILESMDVETSRKKYLVSREMLAHVKECFPIHPTDSQDIEKCKSSLKNQFLNI